MKHYSTIILVALLSMLDILVLKAQLTARFATVEIVPSTEFKSSIGPVMSAHDAEIGIAAYLPASVSQMDRLDLVLNLTNRSSSDITVRDFSRSSCGFDFYFEDASGHEVGAQEKLTNIHRAGKGAINGGFTTTTLKPHMSIIITLPLEEYVAIKSPGEYKLKVSWTDSEAYGTFWRPRSSARLKMEEELSFRNTGKAVSITSP